MVVSREVWGLRDGTPPNKETFPNKEKPFQTRKTFPNKETLPNKENLSKQGKTFPNKKKTPTDKGNTFRARKRLSSKGYLPIKCKSLQVVGVSRQGKAVVSDGGYGVIGGRYCLLVWE